MMVCEDGIDMLGRQQEESWQSQRAVPRQAWTRPGDDVTGARAILLLKEHGELVRSV